MTVLPPEFDGMSDIRMASSSRTPDRTSVQQAAMKALQTRSVNVARLDRSATWRLQAAADYFYILRHRPSSHARVLRHEEERLQKEALTLRALHGRSDILVPRLIEYTNGTSAAAFPHLISGPFKGAILSEIEPSLSSQALDHIDRSRGQYVHRLARVTGPAFGPIRPANASAGTPSWSRCFALLLEAVLSDGEDALVNLPYDMIRDQVRRHRAVLDQITTPKLTLLEYKDENAVVDTSTWAISGLLDFSTAIWGDPFLSDCFYQPATSFLQGYGRTPNRTEEERNRQYLYLLYHTSLAIVKQRFRPSESGDEMAARRDLTTALTRLRAAG